LRLLRGRLIGRTPDFESGYRGSSPRPGANILGILAIAAPLESFSQTKFPDEPERF
jgi:hypothetical protein